MNPLDSDEAFGDFVLQAKSKSTEDDAKALREIAIKLAPLLGETPPLPSETGTIRQATNARAMRFAFAWTLQWLRLHEKRERKSG